MIINCNEMMATDDMTECMFTVGSIVSCLTCFDARIEGEVIAFDYSKKLLVLKSKSSDEKPNLNDVNWINIEFCKDIQIKSEAKREDVLNTQLPQINTQKVDERARTATEERKKLTEAFMAGIGPEGLKLSLTLSKTSLPVTYEADSIIVAGSVKISPPYKVDNCVGIKSRANSPPDSLKFTKKLVEKFWNDQQNKNPQKTQNSVIATDKPPFNNKG